MSVHTLDQVAAVFCGVFAVCLFHIHTISNPKRDNWLTLPAYVRHGLAVSGAMLTWRSVNFVSISSDGFVGVGHINAEGMMALVTLTYTFGALAFWLTRKQLHNHGWSRIDWVERMLRRNPRQAPVVMPLEDIAEAHRARGAEFVAGPNEGPPGADAPP